ncbi:hypothetical protein CAC42_1490 [Sphaceloma murrayae]|uniref:Uncharacterized protein n=1 Tax=Sphaceloma murrayae TaxID=2082308 RepID=A0A2K1QYR5_9PEZI|nr:hypothetical protein CAC42_1490 [Sphaceloma murrayae]
MSPPSLNTHSKGDAVACILDSVLSTEEAEAAYASEFESDERPPPYDAASSVPARDSSAHQPSSSDRSSSSKVPEVWRAYQKLQSVPWTRYMPPAAQLSSDTSTVTIVNIPKDHTAGLVTRVILEQLALPPQQNVKIVGRHNTWEGNKAIDFDLTLNLTPYFISDDGTSTAKVSWQSGCEEGSGSAAGDAVQTEIESAMARSYSNKTIPQNIVIQRALTNWDKAYVATCIHGLLGTTRYKGAVEITYPTSQTKVVIQLPSQEAATEQRGLFSALVQSVTGNKVSYTIKADWQYSSHPVNTDEHGSRSTDPNRSFTSKSEAEWYADWEAVIRRAVVRKERTMLGLDAWMQNMTDPLRKAELPGSDWGANAY